MRCQLFLVDFLTPEDRMKNVKQHLRYNIVRTYVSVYPNCSESFVIHTKNSKVQLVEVSYPDRKTIIKNLMVKSLNNTTKEQEQSSIKEITNYFLEQQIKVYTCHDISLILSEL